MSEKILSPIVEVPEIKVPIDENPVKGTYEGMKTSLGQYVPLLALGNEEEHEYINWAKISNFRLSVGLYILPQVYITVEDADFKIRKHLKNDLDIGICRIGYNNFAWQFKVLFTDIYPINAGEVRLSGVLYDEYMWEDVMQKHYKDISVKDIITESCKDNGLGLNVYDNAELNTVIDNVIQTNCSKKDFLNNLMHQYTTNIWCYDLYYFLHIGSYDSISSENVAQYTLDYKTGLKMKEPHDLIFARNYLFGKDGEAIDKDYEYKIPIKYYDVESEYSDRFLSFKSSYNQFTEKKDSTVPQSDFGVGEVSENTYSGFGFHKIANADKIREKNISKQIIHVFTDYIIPELNPFNKIKLEIYMNSMFSDKRDDKVGDLDVEHSGEKTVIGYSIIYKKKSESNDINQQFTQEILCI